MNQYNDTKWYSWKVMAGYTYIAICIFDFVVMPVALHHVRIAGAAEIVEVIDKQGVEVGIKLISQLQDRTYMWSPVTLHGGGLFHLSFGAILTGAALSKKDKE